MLAATFAVEREQCCRAGVTTVVQVLELFVMKVPPLPGLSTLNPPEPLTL